MKTHAGFTGCFLSEVTGVRERSTFTLLRLAELLTRFWIRIRSYTLVLKPLRLKGKGVFFALLQYSSVKRKTTFVVALHLFTAFAFQSHRAIRCTLYCTKSDTFSTPRLVTCGEVMVRPLLLQSCCLPAEGAAAGPGLILELLREVAQKLFVSF